MRHALLAALVLAAAGSARAQSTATLRGIDVYRSAVLTPAEAHKLFEPRLREYVNLRNFRSAGSHDKAEDMRREMEGQARALPGVAWAELHVSEYFTSVDHAMYAVFDVVDRSDPSRMAFSPAPKGAAKDPDGLLAAWKRYVAAGEAVSLRGEMSPERPNCPGFYCL